MTRAKNNSNNNQQHPATARRQPQPARPTKRAATTVLVIPRWLGSFMMCMMAAMTTTTTLFATAAAAVQLDCDPCIDRTTYRITAVIPASGSSSIRLPMQQSALDMGVALTIIEASATTDAAMAEALQQAVATKNNALVDALVVTLPALSAPGNGNDDTSNDSSLSHAALSEIVATQPELPISGWGWGHQTWAARTEGWIAANAEAAGRQAAQELLNNHREYYNTNNNAAETENNNNNTTATTSDTNVTTTTTTTTNPIALDSVAFIFDEVTLSGPTRAHWQGVLQELNSDKNDPQLQEQGDATPVVNTGGRYDLVHAPTQLDSSFRQALTNSFGGGTCPYQAIFVAHPRLLDDVLDIVQEPSNACHVNVADAAAAYSDVHHHLQIAVFLDDYDTAQNSAVYKAITRQQVALAINPQLHIQASLAVLLAAMYATTGKRLAVPIESSTYWSGPKLINSRNVPSDTLAACEEGAFPVCQVGQDDDSDEDINDENALLGTGSQDGENKNNEAVCPCNERRDIRIGGVLHGVTTDGFWDPVFASAKQAAADMHVDLDLDRFLPQDRVFERMAGRIRNMCESGVDGIFVTIPHESVAEAVRRCHDLRVPVVSVNTGLTASAGIGLVHHVGQDEYSGGYGAAVRMISAGMRRGYCVDHAFGNPALQDRCQGFRDGISALGGGVTFGSHIAVPSDNVEQYVITVSEAVEADGGWEGVGLIGLGADPFPGMRRILNEHRDVIAGTFDTSDDIFAGLRDGLVLFGIDQQPFLQGKMPVYLLTHLISTQQHLTNHVIQSGPSFIEESPSDEMQICEANFYEVCPDRPDEDLAYIPESLLALGYALFALLAIVCIGAFAWTFKFREKWVVKVSQPMFLSLVLLGCFISGFSILFMGFQTSYRIDRDESGKFIFDKQNPQIGLVDMSCMAVPWFYGMGFVITFSALFAKIHRVILVFRAGLQMQRKQVTMADVFPVMGIMFVIEVAILLTWQLVAPLKWEREIVDELDGYPLSSVGSCTGGTTGWYFYLALVIFHVLCLCYALVLCFQAKNINSDFAESSYVSLAVVFMFQVLVLAVPISALVRDNSDVFYFVRAAAVFLQNSTVVVLIFVPKILRMKEEQRNPTNTTGRSTSLRAQSRPSVRQSARQSASRRMPSWAGASLSDALGETEEDESRLSFKFNEDLPAINEDDERGSRGSRKHSGESMGSEHSNSTRRSVRVEHGSECAPVSERAGSSYHKATLLSPQEVESRWEELGFPSKQKARLLLDLFSRNTEPEERQKLSSNLFQSSNKTESKNSSEDCELQNVDDNSKPTVVSPRDFNSHLKSGLSEMADDDCTENGHSTETADTPDNKNAIPVSKRIDIRFL